MKSINAVGAGTFLVMGGAGLWLITRPPAAARTTPPAEQWQVAAAPVRPQAGDGVPRPVRDEALMGIAGFDTVAEFSRLRATLTADGPGRRPGITLRATMETWLVVGGFSQQELEALMLASQELAAAGEVDSCIAVLLEQLAMLNPMRALDLVKRLPPPSTSPTVAGLLEFWGSHDAASARQWYDERQADGAAWFPEVSKVVEKFAERPVQSPSSAVELSEALTAYQKAKAQRKPGSFFSGDAGPVLAWVRRNQQWKEALDAAGDPPLRLFLHSEWAAADPVNWLAWMRSRPTEGKAPADGQGSLLERREILQRALGSICRRAGAEMPAYSLGEQLDGVLALLQEEGTDLRNEFGSGGVFLNMGFPRWIEAQPAEASGWVKRHQNAPWIEPVIVALATHVAKDDPLAAMAWAARIKGGEKRREAIARVHQIWRSLDPEPTDKWAGEHAAELKR